MTMCMSCSIDYTPVVKLTNQVNLKKVLKTSHKTTFRFSKERVCIQVAALDFKMIVERLIENYPSKELKTT